MKQKSRQTKITLLMEEGRLSSTQARQLIFQHPHLTKTIIVKVIDRLRQRGQTTFYSPEEFMSKFSLYASEFVGWQNQSKNG